MCSSGRGRYFTKKENYIDAVIGPQSYHEIKKVIFNIENSNKKINFTEFDVVEKFDQFKFSKKF